MLKGLLLKICKNTLTMGLLIATLLVINVKTLVAQTASQAPLNNGSATPINNEQPTTEPIIEPKKTKGLPTQTMPKRIDPKTMPTPLDGFAWRKAYDVDDGFNKEKIFNLYLDDLLYVKEVGFKAMPSERLDPNLEGKVELNKKYYLEQGEIAQSNSIYHIAIEGNGFFKVQDMEDGSIYYTRRGDFELNEETGELYTGDGYRLESPTKINKDEKNVYIDEKGKLLGDVYRSRESAEIYQFELWQPTDSATVEPFGGHFIFSEAESVTINKKTSNLILGSVELSTSRGNTILARMLESLHEIDNKRLQTIKDNEDAVKQGNPTKEIEVKDTKYQQEMVNFLMREFSISEGDITKLKRFANLVNELKVTLAFPMPKEEEEKSKETETSNSENSEPGPNQTPASGAVSEPNPLNKVM